MIEQWDGKKWNKLVLPFVAIFILQLLSHFLLNDQFTLFYLVFKDFYSAGS